MKKLALPLLLFLFTMGCTNDKKRIPDVSSIKVELQVQRFDEDFFQIDTLNLQQSLNQLQVKYPDFANLFLQNILGVTNEQGIKTYYRLYKPIFDSSQKIYQDFGDVKTEIEHALRFVKYYFPAYKVPAKLRPVVGPMNSMQDFAVMGNGDYTPDFLGPDFAGISLQFYLGRNFSLYTNEYFVNNVAPAFRSRRFSKEYIAADVMKLITEDLFPDKSKGRSLVEQMIDKGKQWWMLDKFMPQTADSVRTGYTAAQLDWCRQNEGLIWSYLNKNEEIFSITPTTIQNYIGEAPFTQGFSQELSPGNIGQWIGWQIVKKFADMKTSLKPEEVMQTSAKTILEESKYKPR